VKTEQQPIATAGTPINKEAQKELQKQQRIFQQAEKQLSEQTRKKLISRQNSPILQHTSNPKNLNKQRPTIKKYNQISKQQMQLMKKHLSL
jgi:hypothetical protein